MYLQQVGEVRLFIVFLPYLHCHLLFPSSSSIPFFFLSLLLAHSSLISLSLKMTQNNLQGLRCHMYKTGTLLTINEMVA